jgi:hypothetical protein
MYMSAEMNANIGEARRTFCSYLIRMTPLLPVDPRKLGIGCHSSVEFLCTLHAHLDSHIAQMAL